MLDFLALAEEYRIPTLSEGHHHCVQGWIQTHCPGCSVGYGWHLGWNIAKGYFSCWRCGKRKTNDVLRSLLPSVPLGELYRRFLSGRRAAPVPVVRRRGAAARVVYPPDTGPLRLSQRAYIIGRGFDPDEIQSMWDVKGVGPCGGIWAYRILMPIHDSDGRVVSYTARAIAEEAQPRYRNLSIEKSVLNPKLMLYGEHLVSGDHVVVVEGPIDAWRVGPGAVALMGAVWVPEQVETLRSFKRITLIPDNDVEGTGLDAMKRLAAWLGSGDSEIELVTGLDSDPGAMSDEEVAELKEHLQWV